jgi:hypothetical protein
MNQTERQKITALGQCRIGLRSYTRRFMQSMIWLRRNEPNKALTPNQKYYLDLQVYTFRAQLPGRLPDELILTEKPEKSAYGIPVEGDEGTVQDIFTGKPGKPHATSLPADEPQPQRSLF